jgi:predicted Rossmann fold nucleotide-binding protein DprA/Smf involved in DNA uptake
VSFGDVGDDCHEDLHQFHPQIVLAKLMKSRGMAEEQKKTFEAQLQKLQKEKEEIQRKSEEEIKETRHEMEGKLEKMKEKMVSGMHVESSSSSPRNVSPTSNPPFSSFICTFSTCFLRTSSLPLPLPDP